MSRQGKSGEAEKKKNRGKGGGELSEGRKKRKGENGAYWGAAMVHPNPHGTLLPIKARLQIVSHSPSHTNAIRQGGKRAIPRRQNRPFPLLKYLCEQKAAAARWLS